MIIQSRVASWAFGLLLATVAVTGGARSLVAQEPADAKASETTPAAAVSKKSNDPSHRVPPFFGQIGLTAAQKDAIYKVRGKHQAKIEALQKEIALDQAEMLGECEALLNDSQKQLLSLRREAAARAKKDKATTPVASSASGKPVN